jgi:hypothetical protein
MSDYIVDVVTSRNTGIVHSMFANSINIKIEGKIININARQDFLSSFGLRVSKIKVDEIIKYCELNNVVVIKNHEIWIYGRYKEIIISLLDYKSVNLKIPILSVSNILKSKVIDKLEQLDYLNGLGIENTQTLKEVNQYLKTSSLTDLEANEEAMMYLIGRGQGLTPSGDDLLMGFTMILMSIGVDKPWSLQLEKMVKDKSTDISLAYYKALFDKHISSYLLDLLISINQLDEMGMDKSVLTLVNYGNTSGYDTLFGCYIGCLWAKNNLKNKGE